MYCNNCGRDIGEATVCPVCQTAVNGAGGFNYAPPVQVENFNMISAYKSMFKKYAQFNGRSRRSEYWYAALANYIIVLVAYAIMFIPMFMSAASGNGSPAMLGLTGIISVLLVIYFLAAFVPSIALMVRRLHDTGRSGWFLLLNLIPYVGGIIVFVFSVLDSQPGPNQYGPNPKGM